MFETGGGGLFGMNKPEFFAGRWQKDPGWSDT
jgi:hypothetical protein